MFDPEELMARIVDLEEQLKVSEMAPPAAEQLIACLEGEIAKRDEELAACRVAVENCEVFRARIAELEQDLAYFPSTVRSLAETVTEREAEINQLRAELAAIKAQEPVEIGEIGIVINNGSKQFVFDEYSAAYALPVGTHYLYAAPVSEAKAQGVVMPERANASHGSHDHQSGWNACLDEVARLNAAPVQQVSVLDGWKFVPVEPTGAMLGAAFDGTGESEAMRVRVNLRFLNAYRAMLNAAPTAPAADAVASLIEWTKDAVEWGGALNYAAWEFVNECPEKSALLFNNTKGPLRAAIMKYAEIVAANAKDSDQ